MQFAIAPYFRRYELPWDPTDETRFRKLLRALLIVLFVVGLIIPLLPRPDDRRPRRRAASRRGRRGAREYPAPGA